MATWIRAGESAPAGVTVSLVYGSPGPSDDKDAKPPVNVASVTVRPGEEWQLVELSGETDTDQEAPLTCVVELEDAAGGQVEVWGAKVAFGKDAPSLLARRPEDPSSWLTSDVRKPDGWFPWALVNRLAWAAPGVPLAAPVEPEWGHPLAKSGPISRPLSADGPAGAVYTARAWALRLKRRALRLAGIFGCRRRERHAGGDHLHGGPQPL